jgi:hypothetical protein
LAGTGQILFIQGGGAGTHDEWDDKLVDSLRRELGDGYEIRYPRMPDEDETVPPAHADRYARVIPQARLHRLPGRDHQLDDDLSEVARAIGPTD